MIELSIVVGSMGVTFVGDQAHAFSPLFGIDANCGVYSFKRGELVTVLHICTILKCVMISVLLLLLYYEVLFNVL